MTEKQRDKVSKIVYAIFHNLDLGHVIKDEEGNVVIGLRYGCRGNKGSWSYVYYNDKSHPVSKPVAYGCCNHADANKKFYVYKGNKKPEVIR